MSIATATENHVLLDGTKFPILGGMGSPFYEIHDVDYATQAFHEGDEREGVPTLFPSVTWASLHRGLGPNQYDGRKHGTYPKARGADARFPGYVILCGRVQQADALDAAPTGRPLFWNGNLYIAAGRYLYRVSHAAGPTQVLDVGAGNKITDIVDASTTSAKLRIVVCVAVAATEAGVAFYYSATGAASSWTQSNRTAGNGGQPRYGQMIRDTLYLFYRPNEMRSAGIGSAIDVDNAGTAFGAITYIGSATANITGASFFREALLVRKEDGYFTATRDAAIKQVFNALNGQQDTQEGNQLHGEWVGDGLFYFVWNTTLLAWDGSDTVTAMSQQGARFLSVPPIAGAGDGVATPTAILPTDGGLWVAFRSRATTPDYLLRWRGYTEEGLPPVWHDQNDFGTNAVNCLGWLPGTTTANPRLYLGYGSNLRYIVQPLTAFPPDDPNYLFESTGRIWYPEHRGLFAGWKKNYLTAFVRGEQLDNSESRFIDLHYVLDGATDYDVSALGRMLNSNPLAFPQDEKGRAIQVRASLFTGDTGQSPVLRYFGMEYDHDPALQVEHSFFVVIGADNMSGRSARDMMSTLVTLRKRGGQVDFIDSLGDQWNAKMVGMARTQSERSLSEKQGKTLVKITMRLYRPETLSGSYYGVSFYGTGNWS